MKVQVKSKTVADWSNRDFLIYFAKKMQETSGHPFTIPPVAWGGFMGRMKGFRAKLVIDNESYKEFIDSIFTDFFAQDGYTPAFGAIVSERVYYVVRKLKSIPVNQHVDWVQFRDELYKNLLLFQKGV